MSKIELVGPNQAINRVMELAVHARGSFKKSASTLSNGNATQLKS